MKTKFKVFLLILILLLVGCFVISASGVKISYFENYGTNFRKNVKNITERLNIDLPQPVEEFLSRTPEPLTTEEKLAIIEENERKQQPSPSPTPEIPVSTEKPLSATSNIIAVKNAYTGAYASYKSGLLCALDALLTFYNSKGEAAWHADIQISSPILKTAGDYILVAEKGASKVYLFKGKKLLWENSIENPIISADISKNGDAVIISDKPHYKGVVTVINRNGDIVFLWNSGKYEVIDADISASSRKLAVSLLNTEAGADTKISFFKLTEGESFNSIDLTDCIAFDIEFCNDTLNAFADNKIIGASSDGKLAWTQEFDGKILHRYIIEDSGYKLCVFDNSNLAQINIINNRGGLKYDFDSQAFPDRVHISDGYLLYNDERTLIFSPLSGKNPKKYNCTRDIYELLILNSSQLAVVYNSSIEFIAL